MKQDIRDLFKNEELLKDRLPEFHREEFLEKLQAQEIEKPKKRNLYFMFKIAASVVILISIAYLFNNNSTISTLEIVEERIDTIDIKSQKEFVENVIVFEKVDENFTNSEFVEKEQLFVKRERIKPQRINLMKPEVAHISGFEELSFQIMDLEFREPIATINEGDTNRIKVDSDALLYSISHTPKEVLAYYKENDLTRESVLLAIENELEKSNLEVNANELLAEIELGLHQRTFKEDLIIDIKIIIKDLSKALANN